MVGNFGLWHKGTMGVRALPMAESLVRRGWEVVIVVPPWETPADSAREDVSHGVRIVNIKLPPRLPLLGHIWIVYRLLRRILREKPDVIHTFKPKAYTGLVATFLWGLKTLGFSKVRLVMDSDDWEGPGGWNELDPLPRHIKLIVAAQEKWGLRHCDALTVASRTLQTLAWSIGVPSDRVHYVPNGVGQSMAVRSPEAGARIRQLYNLGDYPVVLLYTRFFEFSLERMRRIFRRIVTGLPETKLLVVGTGLYGEERELRRLLEEGLGESVAFAGWVDRHDLEDYFAASDVAIYPYDDNLLNRAKCAVKLIDLMAAGLPVVADWVGQNAEYIEDRLSGVLIEPGDWVGFGDAVVALLKDGERQRWLGEKARQRVTTAFSWDKLVETVELAYQTATGG